MMDIPAWTVPLDTPEKLSEDTTCKTPTPFNRYNTHNAAQCAPYNFDDQPYIFLLVLSSANAL